MKTIRQSSKVLGVIALALVCFTFSAAPASAMVGRADLAAETETALTLGERITQTLSGAQDRLRTIMVQLGTILAKQDGSWILD